ncbi:MAG: hypothetical protein ACOC3Z_01645 [Nanoarchaeota archaeon]
MEKNVVSEIRTFLGNEINVTVSLGEILYQDSIILLMKNGEIFEKWTNSNNWYEFKSKEDFKEKTGASLDEEYKDNKSESLLNIFNSIDNDFKDKIEEVYFNDYPSDILSKVLFNFKNK